MEAKKDLMLAQQQRALMITSINTGDYKTVLGSLQSTIEVSVAESVPVKQLINSGAKEPHIVATLAMLVTKFASMLSVGGNLKAGHEVEIAKMLIDEYPTASLDDFQIMLSRGIRGRYGEIFRFDVAVIFGWMGEYMAEWADEKERQLAKQRGQLKTAIEEIQGTTPEVDKMIDDLLAKLKAESQGMKSVPQLTPKEIKQEGQSDPPKPKAISTGYQTNPEIAAMKAKRLQWMRDCFDPITGKPNDNYLTFDEWIRMDKNI